MPTYRKRENSWEVYICRASVNCAEALKYRCNDLDFAL